MVEYNNNNNNNNKIDNMIEIMNELRYIYFLTLVLMYQFPLEELTIYRISEPTPDVDPF
jgi:hypothetical protein